jgi:hypothetical protein
VSKFRNKRVELRTNELPDEDVRDNFEQLMDHFREWQQHVDVQQREPIGNPFWRFEGRILDVILNAGPYAAGAPFTINHGLPFRPEVAFLMYTEPYESSYPVCWDDVDSRVIALCSDVADQRYRIAVGRFN